MSFAFLKLIIRYFTCIIFLLIDRRLRAFLCDLSLYQVPYIYSIWSTLTSSSISSKIFHKPSLTMKYFWYIRVLFCHLFLYNGIIIVLLRFNDVRPSFLIFWYILNTAQNSCLSSYLVHFYSILSDPSAFRFIRLGIALFDLALTQFFKKSYILLNSTLSPQLVVFKNTLSIP